MGDGLRSSVLPAGVRPRASFRRLHQVDRRIPVPPGAPAASADLIRPFRSIPSIRIIWIANRMDAQLMSIYYKCGYCSVVRGDSDEIITCVLLNLLNYHLQINGNLFQ